MLTSQENAQTDRSATIEADRKTTAELLKSLLERAFNAEFTILDGESGEVLETPAMRVPRDWDLCGQLCREAARRGRPEFIEDDDPLLTLALPRTDADSRQTVAVATFLVRPLQDDEDLSGPAGRLGIDAERLRPWACKQRPWTAEVLRQITALVLDNAEAESRLRALRDEAEQLSVNLSSTYEEISLLHRLTRNLKLSKSDEELAHVALDWLGEVVPAAGLAVWLDASPDAGKSAVDSGRAEPVMLTSGECPLDSRQFVALIEHLNANQSHRPIVVNRPITEGPDWPALQIKQLIAVPLTEGNNVFGWLAAINHENDEEFGTVEASLLGSVAAILGIHGGNIELYRQQSELLRGIIRSLSSAIDAKDPYTHGHSDRVARIAVRLAEELGCDEDVLKTVYLAGLLHDVGKIGVDDTILRKPGKLTEEEFEHIKNHAEIGHHILHDLSKLEDVLPVVLHHHESWDGDGYPHHLLAEGIPLAARIIAVADSFDAMSSDRPYRKGMPEERVDSILSSGAGGQWDPAVIDAYFRCSDDIRTICK